MTPDERIEKLLNRAGQTISDLPDKYDEMAIDAAANTAEAWSHRITWRRYVDYILHLTDVIDRMETALENQVTLHEKLMHVIGNADIPEGFSFKQFCLVAGSIYTAVQTAQEGWENYEEGVPKDGSVDDD